MATTCTGPSLTASALLFPRTHTTENPGHPERRRFRRPDDTRQHGHSERQQQPARRHQPTGHGGRGDPDDDHGTFGFVFVLVLGQRGAPLLGFHPPTHTHTPTHTHVPTRTPPIPHSHRAPQPLPRVPRPA